MADSIFHRDTPDKTAKAKLNPHELIGPEVVHLKKGYSVRHGAKTRGALPAWIAFFGVCALMWLYLMDPPIHAWYKGEAAKTYVYLHNYGSGPLADQLMATQIFTPDEENVLKQRITGSFQGYYPSVEAANRSAQKIIGYMKQVKLLHAGSYQELDSIGRIRCLLFVRTGLSQLYLPTQWDFLDPSIGS